MNAYELADLIDSEDTLWMEGRFGDICKMLRQQADRIAELERLVSDMIYEKSSGVYDTPQIKELSDEEIDEIMKQTSNWYEFARAILKKASDK
jgi:hypothetical protein